MIPAAAGNVNGEKHDNGLLKLFCIIVTSQGIIRANVYPTTRGWSKISSITLYRAERGTDHAVSFYTEKNSYWERMYLLVIRPGAPIDTYAPFLEFFLCSF